MVGCLCKCPFLLVLPSKVVWKGIRIGGLISAAGDERSGADR